MSDLLITQSRDETCTNIFVDVDNVINDTEDFDNVDERADYAREVSGLVHLAWTLVGYQIGIQYIFNIFSY